VRERNKLDCVQQEIVADNSTLSTDMSTTKCAYVHLLLMDLLRRTKFKVGRGGEPRPFKSYSRDLGSERFFGLFFSSSETSS
jgi:hypothetical protein